MARLTIVTEKVIACPGPAPLILMSSLSWPARLARSIRRAVGRDREARWNAEWADGAWDRLQALDELGHHAILAGYLARLAPQGALLDVGCGAGTLLDLLRGGYRRYVGIDFAEPVARLAGRASEQTVFVAADMHDFETAERFDVIVFNESAYYFSDLMRGLRQYEGFLAPGGLLLVSMHETPKNLTRWESLGERYRVVDAVTVINQQGTRWTVKVLAPPA